MKQYQAVLMDRYNSSIHIQSGGIFDDYRKAIEAARALPVHHGVNSLSVASPVVEVIENDEYVDFYGLDEAEAYAEAGYAHLPNRNRGLK